MPPPPAPAGAQAVQRALAILDCFRENGADGLSASDLARLTGLSVSTAHRLARTLVAAGFLDQEAETARYRLGAAVAELGQLAFHQRGLHHAAPELEQLSRRTSATADLAIRSGHHALILVGRSVQPGTGLGLRRPLHSTALGKVLLAWAGPNDADGDGLVADLQPLKPVTARTITDPEALRAELRTVRAAGYAVNDGESAEHVRTLAVPVLDRTGTAHAALAVRTTPTVMTENRLPWFLANARTCADALEVLLLPPHHRPLH
ncbi:IclR family transcriptional regulator [Yinghuangia sp. ASG 101]|uniref:IclR family transcriptional regulator n=1 Tax=Yinghuangia sp. ASG 101 TaxID=2896848 RepID=UPI001E313B5E|nr:IclR family transcriptional regulator [Yinghuangia sp. ASG 101]UGQ12110.1 IclR family transcriptional regulator [Yinghuangia sp. ASG 101]